MEIRTNIEISYHIGNLFHQNKLFYVACDVTRPSTWLGGGVSVIQDIDIDEFGPPSHLYSILGK